MNHLSRIKKNFKPFSPPIFCDQGFLHISFWLWRFKDCSANNEGYKENRFRVQLHKSTCLFHIHFPNPIRTINSNWKTFPLFLFRGLNAMCMPRGRGSFNNTQSADFKFVFYFSLNNRKIILIRSSIESSGVVACTSSFPLPLSLKKNQVQRFLPFFPCLHAPEN